MSDTGTVILEQTATKRLAGTPWQVVLHDDPVNYMGFVTMVIQRVFGYPKSKAEKHMMEVHQLGRSVVWTGDREQAELYVHQLQAHHLTATMEKAGGEP
jgi:ATP-dependent Clp protease adaptor protein ClpS